METDSPVVYHGTSESRFPPEQVKRTQAQLTSDEIRVLRECNKESFYYRCLPFAVAGMTATFLAVKQGIFKGHPKWGPAGKMTGAAFLGWFLGKFSYRSKCEEKFLKLEHSAVADAVRKRRGYTSSEAFESERSRSSEEELGTSDVKYTTYSTDDYNSSSASLNLDVDKNVTYSGLDDRERPSTDRENPNFGDQNEPIRKITTYEELRRKNRQEYDRANSAQTQINRPDSSQSAGIRRQWNQSDEPPRRFNPSQSEGSAKNVYGDTWDNPKFQ